MNKSLTSDSSSCSSATPHVSELTPDCISLTSCESRAFLQSVACETPISHLDLLHHLREHAILFKALLTPGLNYSHLHSLTLFDSEEHLQMAPTATNTAEAGPCQQTHLFACGDRIKQSCLSSQWQRHHWTKHINKYLPTKQLCNL